MDASAGIPALDLALGDSHPPLLCCAYGHEVGRATVLRLRAADPKARYLPGIDGRQAAGQALNPEGASS